MAEEDDLFNLIESYESDSDYGEDNYDSITSSTVDYVEEANAIKNANKNITNENALKLNKHLREYLEELKRKLEAFLQNCRDKHKSNVKLISAGISDKANASKNFLRLPSFFICGNPYFKGMDQFSAPLNSDYLYRKNVQHEYFPIDDIYIYRQWSAKDKWLLVNGVKQQFEKFSMSNQRNVARKVKSNTRRKPILEDRRPLDGNELSKMFDMIKDRDFKIDWSTISTKYLDDRHTPNECAIWITKLIQSLKLLPWTTMDDEKLRRIAEKFKCQNWTIIGEEMNGRSGYDCIIRYQGLINDESILKDCSWTKAEDRLLNEAVETCRIGSFIPWTKVADKLPLRSKRQVYQRYMYTLKPDIKKERFTVEEDCIITAAVKKYGTNFNEFSTNLLPGRTLVQIRHRYNDVLKHVNTFKEWTAQDDIKLMELTKQLGTTNWVDISKHLIHHTRVSCRCRYITITNFLEKNPNCDVKDVPRRARKQSTKVKEDNWEEQMDNYKKKLHDEETAQIQAGPDFRKFLSFSYNFELRQLCEADDPASDKCKALSYMLQSTVYPKDHKLLYGGSDCSIEVGSMASCEDSKEYTIPPNWSTALILRGLSIMYPNTRKKSNQVFGDTPALQLFKKRFFLLLYSSAVASHTTLPDSQSKNLNAITDARSSTNTNRPAVASHTTFPDPQSINSSTITDARSSTNADSSAVAPLTTLPDSQSMNSSAITDTRSSTNADEPQKKRKKIYFDMPSL